jgi:hypothetical protein
MLKLTKLDWWGFTFQTYLPTTRQSGQPQFLLAAFSHHHLFINRIKKKHHHRVVLGENPIILRWMKSWCYMNQVVEKRSIFRWKKEIQVFLTLITSPNKTQQIILSFFFINVGVRIILRAPRLILWVLKLTTM